MIRRAMTAVVIVCVCSAGAAAQEYQRGAVPDGGLVFRASFDNGAKADHGAGWLEFARMTRGRSEPQWAAKFSEGRLGKALDLRRKLFDIG